MSKITLIQRWRQTLFKRYGQRYINVESTFTCYLGRLEADLAKQEKERQDREKEKQQLAAEKEWVSE